MFVILQRWHRGVAWNLFADKEGNLICITCLYIIQCRMSMNHYSHFGAIYRCSGLLTYSIGRHTVEI